MKLRGKSLQGTGLKGNCLLSMSTLNMDCDIHRING